MADIESTVLLKPRIPGTDHGARAARQQDVRKRLVKYRVLYLFLVPAVITTVIFSYVPMVGVVMAFQDFKIQLGYLGSPLVGFKYFQEFLRNKDFFLALKNTLIINSLNIAIGFPLPIIFAFLLNEIRSSAFKRVTQTITYLPHFISWIVIAGLFYRLLDYSTGSANQLLVALGGQRVGFFREPAYFWTILISLSLWKDFGWNSIIYLAAITGIEVEQYEAATVDGATRLQKAAFITLPGIFPIIALMLILTIGGLFASTSSSSFEAVYSLRNAMVTEAAQVLDIYVYTEGIRFNHLPYAAAIGLAQSVVSFLMVCIANTVSRRLRGYGAF
jgi:putative aldouronate transport system permease protein